MKKPDPEIWGPPGFADWMRRRPSDVSGKLPIPGTLNELHHEPSRGSRRAHWTKTCTLTREEHTSGPHARHGLNSGVKTFWKRWKKNPEEIFAIVQAQWKERAGQDFMQDELPL